MIFYGIGNDTVVHNSFLPIALFFSQNSYVIGRKTHYVRVAENNIKICRLETKINL